MSRLILLAAAIVLSTLGAHASPLGQKEIRLYSIGKTGIYCVKAPCPWRGIVDLRAGMPKSSQLLWSGDALPPLLGEPQEIADIREAWDQHGCLQVEGRFDGKQFAIARIIGSCP